MYIFGEVVTLFFYFFFVLCKKNSLDLVRSIFGKLKLFIRISFFYLIIFFFYILIMFGLLQIYQIEENIAQMTKDFYQITTLMNFLLSELSSF